MSAQKPKITKKRSLSWVWLLPFLAFLLAGWMIFQTNSSLGPVIEVRFDTAEGIQAGKTKVKSRSVEIGIVEQVNLSESYDYALVVARIEKRFEGLLKKDSEIWVVRPRVGNGGISGIGTILSGAYLNLLPGTSEEMAEDFVGLEEPPVIPSSGEGLRIVLVTDNAKSIAPGVSIFYRGFKVGSTESTHFNSEKRQFECQVFIEAEYSDLVCSSTRFWNESGVNFTFDTEGIDIQTGALESVLSGGIAFDVPEGVGPGDPCEHGTEYRLYDNYSAVLDQPYEYYAEYILLFDSSVRGLKKGAPVEYRGIQVGSVVEISMDYLPDAAAYQASENPVPVLVRIDPGRFRYGDTEEAVELTRRLMHERVNIGVRAWLSTGNLLTGAMYIAVDYVEGVEPATIGMLGEYETFPTINRGIAQIESQVTSLLEKLNALELKTTIENLEQTLLDVKGFVTAAEKTVAGIDSYIAGENFQNLPENLVELTDQMTLVLQGLNSDSPIYQSFEETLKEIEKAVENVERYTNTLNSKPNSLIFSGTQQKDPDPEN